MDVRVIASKLARETVEREHYAKRKPMVSHAFGLFLDDVLVGVVTFGLPASNQVKLGVCPSNPSAVLELNRLWIQDDLPINTASWFVSRALGMLPARIVISYADTATVTNDGLDKKEHLGYVYRALNFYYAGWTDMERKSARWDYVKKDQDRLGHSRNAFRGKQKWSLENGDYRVQRVPKVKYWIVTGNKTEKKALTQQCGWPRMDWKAEPPPTTHKQRTVQED